MLSLHRGVSNECQILPLASTVPNVDLYVLSLRNLRELAWPCACSKGIPGCAQALAPLKAPDRTSRPVLVHCFLCTQLQAVLGA